MKFPPRQRIMDRQRRRAEGPGGQRKLAPWGTQKNGGARNGRGLFVLSAPLSMQSRAHQPNPSWRERNGRRYAGTNTPVIHFYAGTYGSSLTLAMTPQGGADRNIWSSAPLHHNIWTRIAVDAFCTPRSPRLVGSRSTSTPTTGDGHFADSGEQSPVVHGQTLLRQLTAGCSSSPCRSVGDSIPDHLRADVCHDPDFLSQTIPRLLRPDG